jgi:DNA-binding winged helix-turn-helix (wHTH) protein
MVVICHHDNISIDHAYNTDKKIATPTNDADSSIQSVVTMSVQLHTFAPAAVDLARESDVRLGALLIRPSRRELVVRGRRVRLEPRVMQVLVALVRAEGGVVSRAELIERCWSGRIVGEDAVYRCIVCLRALAVTLEGAFCIETIARVGYRLMGAEACANGGEPPRRSWPHRAADALVRFIGQRR